ncbi:MAG TPA: hypothetical protein VJG90_05325 [Candidatus Nanoarchaeia archaeon]|nr:hypothetical protein [Candidatus Nanoarchaeia archaeon]
MSLDRKVRFEYDELTKEEAIKRVEEAGFRVIPMKYTEGLFGQYQGSGEAYQTAVQRLEEKGVQVVYRESKTKENI